MDISKNPLEDILNLLQLIATAFLIISLALTLYLAVAIQLNFNTQGIHGWAQTLTVWLAFLLAPKLELDDRHITVDFLFNRTSRNIKKAMSLFVTVIGGASALAIVAASAVAIEQFGSAVLPSLGVSALYFYSAPFFGMLLLTIVYIIKLTTTSYSIYRTYQGEVE